MERQQGKDAHVLVARKQRNIRKSWRGRCTLPGPAPSEPPFLPSLTSQQQVNWGVPITQSPPKNHTCECVRLWEGILDLNYNRDLKRSWRAYNKSPRLREIHIMLFAVFPTQNQNWFPCNGQTWGLNPWVCWSSNQPMVYILIIPTVIGAWISIFCNMQNAFQMWCCTPVVSPTQKGEAGGSVECRSSRPACETQWNPISNNNNNKKNPLKSHPNLLLSWSSF